ncbi:MAG TPA: DUF4932 domain-containing protein, partial [Elusimicrobiota bacterium]|nr:DUF4932 domain-containing protein [Elusimicrobiota bacterium]
MRRPLAAGLLLAALAARSARAADASRIEVSLDPRLELLGAVQLLSPATSFLDGFVRRDVPAVRELSASLAPFAGLPAVPASAAFDPNAFSYYTRADVFLRLSPPPELAPRLIIPDLFVSDAGGRAALDAWLAAMRAFDRDAGFPAYFEKEKALLAGPVSAFRGDVEKKDYIAKIERYTGLPFDGTYAVHLSPFVKTGSQVNSVVLQDDGSYAIQSIVGPDERGGKLDFLPGQFPGTAWHELGHGILDTLSDLNQDEINRNAELENKLAAARWSCYGGVWEQCVKEHVVRAVMIRLIALNIGDEAAATRLREEGEDKFPYLKPMLDSLRVYEAHREKYPTIADYFPQLLKVFPKPPPPPAAAPLPPLAQGDPGPNWIMQSVRPFATAGQRARALAYVNRTRAPSPALRRMRAALELLAGRNEAAGREAGELFASDPDDSGAALIAAAAALKTGDDAGAKRVALAGSARCRAAAGAADLDRAQACRSLESLSGRPGGPASAASARPAAREPRVEFAIDPRVELLSVVAMLAYPSEFAAEFPNGESAYARDAERSFAAMKGDPAVAFLRRIVERRSQPNLPAEMLLSAPAGVDADRTGFLAALDDFSKRSDFQAFYARHAADYRAFVADARREAPRQFPPSDAEEYLRTTFPDVYRFILSPLLPSRFDSNAIVSEGGVEAHLRMRSAMYDDQIPKFDFESFGAGTAHELIHTVADPLALPFEQEIDAYGGEAPPRCADRWMGCVREQVVFAVTLRILARVSGDAAYRAQLLDSVNRGFPQLPALCERLKEYEASPSTESFAAFYPRLVDVFREALQQSIRAQAEASLPEIPENGSLALDTGVLAASTQASDGAAEASPAEPAGKASVVFAVDPRLELSSLLLALAPGAPAPKGESYRARALRAFAPFAREPAVGEAAEMEKRSGQSGFVAQLFARLSDPPSLEVAVPVPGSFVKQAGGKERVLRLLADAREFSRRSGFMRFFDAHRPDYRRLVAEARDESDRALPPSAAEQYLGEPFTGAYTVALTSLLPGEAETFLVSSEDGRATYLRSSGDAEGPVRFGLETFGNSFTHELIHTVTNPLVSSYGNSEAPPPGCNDHGGGSWSACIQEHLVYAVELRVMAQTLGEKVYLETAGRWAQRGFPYLIPLGDELKDYEADRARYASLREFYPRLAETLRRKLPADAQAPAREAARRSRDLGVTAFLKGDQARAEREFLAAAKDDPD